MSVCTFIFRSVYVYVVCLCLSACVNGCLSVMQCVYVNFVHLCTSIRAKKNQNTFLHDFMLHACRGLHACVCKYIHTYVHTFKHA